MTSGKCDEFQLGKAMGRVVTAEMVKDGMEQWRLDSSCMLTGEQRIERMLRAALSGGTDQKLFNDSITITTVSTPYGPWKRT